MKIEETFMTKTIQPRSWTLLNETNKDLPINKSETKDNMEILLTLFDNLNALYIELNNLNYLVERKIMEHNTSPKTKGESK